MCGCAIGSSGRRRNKSYGSSSNGMGTRGGTGGRKEKVIVRSVGAEVEAVKNWFVCDQRYGDRRDRDRDRDRDRQTETEQTNRQNMRGQART